MKKYQIIFWDRNYDEVPLNQLFNSVEEANKWIQDKEWEDQYYDYDDEKGGDYLDSRTMYFNPEDKENYYGYDIVEI
jgi:hypothetical protein